MNKSFQVKQEKSEISVDSLEIICCDQECSPVVQECWRTRIFIMVVFGWFWQRDLSYKADLTLSDFWAFHVWFSSTWWALARCPALNHGAGFKAMCHWEASEFMAAPPSGASLLCRNGVFSSSDPLLVIHQLKFRSQRLKANEVMSAIIVWMYGLIFK